MIAEFLLPNEQQLRLVPSFLVLLVLLNRYVFGYFFALLKTREAPRYRGIDQPTVCIIVPMYNEGRSVAETVASIQAQDYPADRLKYIIIDDCSRDDSARTVEQAIKNDPRGELIRNAQNMGKRLSIANAVHYAGTDIIVSVDSDVWLVPDAVSSLVAELAIRDVAAVGGRVGVSNANRNWLTKMQTIKYFIGYEFLKGLENTFSSVMCLSGCLTAYRTEVLLEVEEDLLDRRFGPFPIKYGEDRYLTRMLVQRGHKTYLHSRTLCFTKAPDRIFNFFAQQTRWRRSNLVDYFGGIKNILTIHPVVAIHYVALACVFLIYPTEMALSLAHQTMGVAFLLHIGILSFLGLYYWVATRKLPRRFKVNPILFLAMSFVMPVTYLLLTPLALFTLDTGSWETRKI